MSKYLTEALDALECVVRENIRNIGSTDIVIPEYGPWGTKPNDAWQNAIRVLAAHDRLPEKNQ